jgi:LmbE family N-acetylglucosaminyl deacetylase
MKWMRERDLLIAQTMAFVQSVTGKKPDADRLFANSAALTAAEASKPADAPASNIPDLEALLADTTIAVAPPKAVEIARPDTKVDVQSEIRARVANFRAHQERFSREREAYCSTTMAKVHASLREDAVPPRLGK